MQFSWKVLLFVCVAALAVEWNRAASLEEIGADTARELAAALEELSSLRDSIAAEKVPIAERLNDLENRTVQKRQELSRKQRSADNKLVELNALKSNLNGLKEERAYVAGLFSEYVQSFETGIHISEVKHYEAFIDAAKESAANRDLAFIDKMRAQAALLNASLDRIERLMGGDSFEGRALSPNGVLERGKFVLVGPISVFSSEESENGGLAQLQLGSPEPTVIDLGDKRRNSVRALAESDSGMLPVDASLGNALKISATEDTFLEHLKKGGPVMIPILGLGIAAILIALFRWVDLSQNRLVSPEDLQLVLICIKADNVQKAKEHAAKMKGVVGDILAMAIENCGEKTEYIEEILYERMLSAKPSLQRMLPFIALTATTAPLLGLLGTVTGMINTFNMITVFGTGDPRMLSAGISEALITTKFGLVVAVPALICHAVVSRKAKGILGSMEQVTVGFVNSLPEVEKTESEKS